MISSRGTEAGAASRSAAERKKNRIHQANASRAYRRRAALVTRNMDRLEFQLILNYFNDGLAACVCEIIVGPGKKKKCFELAVTFDCFCFFTFSFFFLQLDERTQITRVV